MGVKGLSSFFDRNQELYTSYKLHDTRVIVDGNNLVYTLYFTQNIDCLYGGDYNRYAQVVRKYFSNLLSCNIKPVIIFDGGYEPSQKKLQTVISRKSKNLRSAKFASKNGSCMKKLLPLLAKEVFRNIMEEMAIPQVQCDFEADEHIVVLANFFQCPVISQDSDFYIFDLHVGFIRLDSIDEAISQEEINGTTINFLNCAMYNVNTFLACFPGLDRSILPLVGTLMGNDYVDRSVFSNFFANIALPEIRSKKLTVPKRHARLVGLLHWLQDRTPSEALEQVLSRLKKNDRQLVRQLVSHNISNYENLPTMMDLGCTELPLRTSTGKSLPSWLLKEIRTAVHPAVLINATITHKLFLQVQIECFEKKSIHFCSLFLRQVIYGIALSITVNDRKNDLPLFVEECDRFKGDLKWNKIEPLFVVPGYGQVPNMLTISNMAPSEKKKFVCAILGCSKTCVDEFPDYLQLIAATLLYAQKHSQPEMGDVFVCACLVCIIFLTVMSKPDNERSSSDQCSETLPLQSLLLLVDAKHKEELMQRMCKYFSKPQHTHAKRFQLDVVHNFGQVQSCVLYAMCLNSILQFPFKNPLIDLSFNGIFIYNFTMELKMRKSPQQYILQLFAPGSLLRNIYMSVLKWFEVHIHDTDSN